MINPLYSFHNINYGTINHINNNYEIINKEKTNLETFIKSLNIDLPIIFIGKGKTLNQRINRKMLNKILGFTDYYICCINDSWICCDNYDFIVSSDELFIEHYISSPKTDTSAVFLTSSFLTRWNFEKSFNIEIPYYLYKNISHKNLLCAFQLKNNYGHLKIKKQYDNSLCIIDAIRGGQISIEFFLNYNFKHIYTIGMTGPGYSSIYLNNNNKASFKDITHQKNVKNIIETGIALKNTYSELENKYNITLKNLTI